MRGSNCLLVNSYSEEEEEALLLSRTHVTVFAAEVVHHHTVGIPGKRTEREKKRESTRACFITRRMRADEKTFN